MITEHDLQEAIAECEGQRNPTANTCIKLAAFYTIKQHMFPNNESVVYSQSFSPAANTLPNVIEYDSGSEFSTIVNGMRIQDVMQIMDDVMETLSIVNPKFYNSIMKKLSAY